MLSKKTSSAMCVLQALMVFCIIDSTWLFKLLVHILIWEINVRQIFPLRKFDCVCKISGEYCCKRIFGFGMGLTSLTTCWLVKNTSATSFKIAPPALKIVCSRK